MKRRSLIQGTAAAVLGVPGLSGLAQQSVTLKFHTFMAPLSSVWLTMHKPWMEKVEKDSGGRIKFEAYPAMQLGGTPVQLYDQARDGVVDIVWTVNGYTAGLFPRTEAFHHRTPARVELLDLDVELTPTLVELDELPAEVRGKVRLVFLNYPNNPTGAVAPMDYLERTVSFCRKHGIVLAYDNPYCDLTFDGYRAPSIFQVAGAREVAVEFFSMSKSFSMTGWRLGWAAGAAPFIQALTRIKTYVDTGPFLATQKAAVAALEQSEKLVAPNLAELTKRRDAGVAALKKAGFSLESPKGAMYLWVAVPPGIASAQFATWALEEEGVIVLPGSGFGPGGEGFFRIALTVAAARLTEAAERLGRVLARHREDAVAPAW